MIGFFFSFSFKFSFMWSVEFDPIYSWFQPTATDRSPRTNLRGALNRAPQSKESDQMIIGRKRTAPPHKTGKNFFYPATPLKTILPHPCRANPPSLRIRARLCIAASPWTRRPRGSSRGWRRRRERGRPWGLSRRSSQAGSPWSRSPLGRARASRWSPAFRGSSGRRGEQLVRPPLAPVARLRVHLRTWTYLEA